MILIISYDAVINIYLTALFITPIKGKGNCLTPTGMGTWINI